ncbi:unnamed protein product [Calicophoron daubneyi]|uniref:Hormone-sensitive lipase n=1 Tax=Calicophoron daubneyi TaxID=300641 RepID=A0AAV2THY3_CALDB
MRFLFATGSVSVCRTFLLFPQLGVADSVIHEVAFRGRPARSFKLSRLLTVSTRCPGPWSSRMTPNISSSDAPSKSSLDRLERINLIRLCSEVHLQCRTCIAIIDSRIPQEGPVDPTNSHTSRPLLGSLKKMYELLNPDFVNALKDIYSFVGNYDYADVRANGLRSFLLITTRCLASVLTHLRGLNSSSLMKWSGTTERFLIAYVNCFAELTKCIKILRNLPEYCAPGSLFPLPEFTGLPEIGFNRMGLPSDSPQKCSSRCTRSKSHEEAVDNEKLLKFQNLQTRADQIRQQHFYGRCVAFYFCPSAHRVLLVLTSIMAGYGNSFLASKQGLSNIVNTVYRSVTSFLSPEERGLMVAKLTRNASVQFLKTFWSLGEHRVLCEGQNVILPTVAVLHSFELTPRKLLMPVREGFTGLRPASSSDTGSKDQIAVNFPVAHFGPAPVSVRLLSHRVRPGMEWARPSLLNSILSATNLSTKPNDAGSVSSMKCETMSNTSTPFKESHKAQKDSPNSATSPPGKIKKSTSLSRCLLFHIHGGGFVAMSAQSQDVFLKPWAEFLDCPVFSVDYSLAPEAPYPRALEECYFAYCWAALNLERLGAAPDASIVVFGDSAGGNLALSLCLRIAYTGIKPFPAGVMVAYAPTLIAFTPSPSRMLSLADPLLPIGILSRCLLAYAGVDEALLGSYSPSAASSGREDVDESSVDDLHSRRHSTLSDVMWNRLLPSFWLNGGRPSPKISQSATMDSLYSPKSPPPPSGASLPNGLSDVLTNFKGSDEDVRKETGLTESCTFNLSDSDSGDTQKNEATSTTSRLESSRLRASHEELKREPESDLDRVRAITFPQDYFLSPYLASDELMRQLPPLGILASHFDPFLDDCLELAKRASKLGIPVDLEIMDDLPHGFLNLAPLGPEFHRASKAGMMMAKRLLEKNEPANQTDDPIPSPEISHANNSQNVGGKIPRSTD